jgi:CheY-like chemotaxis protein/anti-sigma regulatory factor (Ser/Thr protein kinase)
LLDFSYRSWNNSRRRNISSQAPVGGQEAIMNRKALVVEDEPETGELLAEILRRRGYQPTVLAEGKPAISWTHENEPELILLDLMLPDVDGYDICENLKLERETNLIPIIMVTARDQPKDKIHGLQVGANHYLTKPFSVEQLNQAIDRALAWRDELKNRGAAGEIHFQLKSDSQYLDELNHLLGSLFLFSGVSEDQVRQLITAVREMGTNAIEWGHNKQVDLIVTVTYRIDPEKVAIVIKDTGPGFDRSKLHHAAKPDDPVSHMMVRETLGMREGGFGILMARGLVDELEYNETGNEVRLVKYYAPQRQATVNES